MVDMSKPRYQRPVDFLPIKLEMPYKPMPPAVARLTLLRQLCSYDHGFGRAFLQPARLCACHHALAGRPASVGRSIAELWWCGMADWTLGWMRGTHE